LLSLPDSALAISPEGIAEARHTLKVESWRAMSSLPWVT
jgi:hypothetical protein